MNNYNRTQALNWALANDYTRPGLARMHPDAILRVYEETIIGYHRYQAGAVTWAMVAGGILTIAIALIAR